MNTNQLARTTVNFKVTHSDFIWLTSMAKLINISRHQLYYQMLLNYPLPKYVLNDKQNVFKLLSIQNQRLNQLNQNKHKLTACIKLLKLLSQQNKIDLHKMISFYQKQLQKLNHHINIEFHYQNNLWNQLGYENHPNRTYKYMVHFFKRLLKKYHSHLSLYQPTDFVRNITIQLTPPILASLKHMIKTYHVSLNQLFLLAIYNNHQRPNLIVSTEELKFIKGKVPNQTWVQIINIYNHFQKIQKYLAYLSKQDKQLTILINQEYNDILKTLSKD